MLNKKSDKLFLPSIFICWGERKNNFTLELNKVVYEEPQHINICKLNPNTHNKTKSNFQIQINFSFEGFFVAPTIHLMVHWKINYKLRVKVFGIIYLLLLFNSVFMDSSLLKYFGIFSGKQHSTTFIWDSLSSEEKKNYSHPTTNVKLCFDLIHVRIIERILILMWDKIAQSCFI